MTKYELYDSYYDNYFNIICMATIAIEWTIKSQII